MSERLSDEMAARAAFLLGGLAAQQGQDAALLLGGFVAEFTRARDSEARALRELDLRLGLEEERDAALDLLTLAVGGAEPADEVWLGHSWTKAAIDLLKKAGRR